MGFFNKAKHRGQKASNYSGGAPAYEGRHVMNDTYAHDNQICNCNLCPDHKGNAHCSDHDNGCHVNC